MMFRTGIVTAAGPATLHITDTVVANLEGAVNNLPSSSNSNNISSFEPKPNYLRTCSISARQEPDSQLPT